MLLSEAVALAETILRDVEGDIALEEACSTAKVDSGYMLDYQHGRGKQRIIIYKYGERVVTVYP